MANMSLYEEALALAQEQGWAAEAENIAKMIKEEAAGEAAGEAVAQAHVALEAGTLDEVGKAALVADRSYQWGVPHGGPSDWRAVADVEQLIQRYAR
jgi:hypothetical protein